MNPPTPQRRDDPAVLNFLNRVRGLEDDVAYERDRAVRLAAELSAAQHLINHHESEIARLTIEHDRMRRVASILETHMKQVWGAAGQGIEAAMEAERELGRPPLIPETALSPPSAAEPPAAQDPPAQQQDGAGRMASLFAPRNLDEAPDQN